MVLPEAKSAKMFQELKLNLYADPNGSKCHFKDVCLALTKTAMMKKGFTDIQDMEEDEAMRVEWEENYESLRSRPLIMDSDTGKYWGSLFISKLLKEVIDTRNRYNKKRNMSITFINERISYSKKLRQIEEDHRKQDFMQKE